MAPWSAGSVGVVPPGAYMAIAFAIAAALPGKGAMAAAGGGYAATLQKLSPGSEKKPIPAPMPALAGALMNALTASVTAVQRVGGVTTLGGLSQAVSAAAHCMEIDLSTMMKRSTAIIVLSRASAAQAASGSSGPVVLPSPLLHSEASDPEMRGVPPAPGAPPTPPFEPPEPLAPPAFAAYPAAPFT